jgi:hypothetical protein
VRESRPVGGEWVATPVSALLTACPSPTACLQETGIPAFPSRKLRIRIGQAAMLGTAAEPGRIAVRPAPLIVVW